MRVRTKAAMSIFIVLLLLIAAALLLFRGAPRHSPHAIIDIEFDDGLGKGHRQFKLVEQSAADQSRYRTLKKVWQRNRPSCAPPACRNNIPKVIHQIWLGPKHMPEYIPRFSREWKRLHPDWEYRLWTDADVETLDFDLKDLYNKSSNYGEKSDILRCEILLKHGGMYVDTDFEVLKSFDEFVEKYDFFAGVEYPHPIRETNRMLLVSNALIGTAPNHPIMKRWKERIRETWQQTEEERLNPIEKVMIRTFFTFGDAVEAEIESEHWRNIVFPSTYFYPIKPAYLKNLSNPPSLFEKVLQDFGLKRDRSFTSLNPEACAVHHFSAKWQKSHHELFKDVQQELQILRKSHEALVEQVQKMQAEMVNIAAQQERERA